ncbi:MAG: DnaA/Hda family protein [Patescibacteria group bacterium]
MVELRTELNRNNQATTPERGDFMPNTNGIWTEILGQLPALGVDEHTMTFWASQCQFGGIINQQVTILASSQFVGDWVRDNGLADKIVEAANMAESCHTEIRSFKIVVDNQIKLSEELLSEVDIDSEIPFGCQATIQATTVAPAPLRASAHQRSTKNRGWGNYREGNLVVGKANNFATAAIIELVKPNRSFKGLLLIAPQGRGKSLHLEAACFAFSAKHNSAQKIVFVSGDEFLAHYCGTANGNGGGKKFDDQYTGVDLLALDGLERMAGNTRKGTQDALARVLDRLERRRAPVLIASTMPLDELALTPDLSSRLQSLVPVSLNLPDTDMRREITGRKLAIWGLAPHLQPSGDSLSFLAGLPVTDMRELVGHLDNILLHSKCFQRQLTLDEIRELVLGPTKTKPPVTCELVCATIAEHYPDLKRLGGLAVLAGKRRDQDVAFYRHLAMYLCLKLVPDVTGPDVAKLFNRDRTSVSHGVDKINELLKSDEGEDLRFRVARICDTLGCTIK